MSKKKHKSKKNTKKNNQALSKTGAKTGTKAKAKAETAKDTDTASKEEREEYHPSVKTVAGIVTSVDADAQASGASTENNLEFHKMKFSERMKAKKEWMKLQMEGMSGKEKVGYFLYYYKWKLIFGIFALILLITVPITIYQKTRPVALSYAVINCDEPAKINTGLIDDYIRFYQIDPSYQVIADKDVSLNLSDYNEDVIHSNNNTDYSQFPLLCHNNYFDLVFTDRDGLLFCASQAVIQPLEYGLYPDVYELVQDNYGDRIVEVENYNGDLTPYAIDISNTPFAENFGLGFSKVYLCFPGTSERNFTNNRKFLNYILTLGLDL